LLRLNPVLAAVLLLTPPGMLAQKAVRAVGPAEGAQAAGEGQVVTLAGNVHPLARAEFDRGALRGEARLDRMMLLLTPSAAQQAALDALVEAQQDRRSPAFHRWLTPAEFGARFGAAEPDRARIAQWLAAHGFTVEEVPAGGRLIVFSGTAAQVEETFHTQMHRYLVNGAEHIANAQDPQIPVTLARVVGGIVSLHDFRRASGMTGRRALGSRAQWTLDGAHYMFPADFATIYDLNPVYAAGTAGAGVTIAIVGRSNINVSDVAAFRASAALKANNPAVIVDGANPGLVAGDQDEATLDVEWAGAVAPAATAELVANASTQTTDGVDLSAAYIVNHALGQVVTTSYGSCEQSMGATELAFYNSLWQQAAVEGMTSLVASGDAGAAGCDQGSDRLGAGAGVNGLCSSPYATCVGGTEFDEGSNGGQYWSAANSPSHGSALSYIPEKVWNESASEGGYGLWATGGGVSQVYAQPAWQQEVSGAGTDNGMRAVPDVAMSAAGHDGYVLYEDGSDWIVSGTSAATPALAGVLALVVERQGGAGQGGANPTLYGIANAEANPFHATPAGTNSVPGTPGFTASGATYNLATGLGSVDGALLVSGWGAGDPPATLALAPSQSSVAILQGSSGTANVTIATGGPFAGPLTLTVAGLPAGVAAVWNWNPVAAAGGNATITFSASRFAKSGTSTAILTAGGDGLSATAEIQVEVAPARLATRRGPVPILPRAVRQLGSDSCPEPFVH